MPVWSKNMTYEDHCRNMDEYRVEELSRARRLRAEAKAMIAEAERIENLWRKKND